LPWDGSDGHCGASSKEAGVRRETAGAYLKAAGIGVRPPGAWGRRAPAKAANETEVTTGSDAAKPVFGLSNYKAITLIENIQATACTQWNPFCAAKIVRQFPASLSELDRFGP
jgi:hypothetical protein